MAVQIIDVKETIMRPELCNAALAVENRDGYTDEKCAISFRVIKEREMKMKLFAVCKEHFELKTEQGKSWPSADIADAVFSQSDRNQKGINTYTNLDAAREALQLYKSEARTSGEHSYNGVTLLTGDILFIEEHEYEDPNEEIADWNKWVSSGDSMDYWIAGGDVCDYIAEPRIMVTDKNGNRVNYASAVALMDDDIRKALHAELDPCTEQEFFTAYEKAHEERYGKPFYD